MIRTFAKIVRAVGRSLPAPKHAIRDMRGGYRLSLNPSSDPHERELYRFRTYEPATLALMDKVLRPGDVMVDVGANLGLMTLHGSRRVGDKGRVVAIEPHPMMFERLSGHLALNNCRNVRALQLAAGAHHGTATLYDVPAVAIGRASLLKPEAKHVASGVVQVVTLDSILSEYPSIRFLKIDIEGYEAQALAGAAETLRKQPVICMEVVRSHGGDPFAAHEAIISTGLYEPFVFSGGKSKASSLVPLLDHKGIRHDNVVYIPLGESAAMLRG